MNLETSSGDKVDVIAVREEFEPSISRRRRGGGGRGRRRGEEVEDEDEKMATRCGYDELKWLRKMALVSKALDSKVYGDAHYIL